MTPSHPKNKGYLPRDFTPSPLLLYDPWGRLLAQAGGIMYQRVSVRSGRSLLGRTVTDNSRVHRHGEPHAPRGPAVGCSIRSGHEVPDRPVHKSLTGCREVRGLGSVKGSDC